MENSDIDDDFTLDGNALHRNKKEKDLRKKEDLLALVLMVRVTMRLDDDDDAVVVVVLVAIVLAPANIMRVCLARLLSGRSDVNAKRLQSLHFSPNTTNTTPEQKTYEYTNVVFSSLVHEPKTVPSISDTLPRFRLDSVQREDVLYAEVGFSATPTTTECFFGVASPQQIIIIEQRDDESSSSAGGARTTASKARGRGEEVVGREPFGGRVSCCCCQQKFPNEGAC